MIPNNPFYADLSTYNTKKSIEFYKKIFNWNFYLEDNYYYAYKIMQPVIGLYETPEKFKQMRMPHFWMTYIQVNDVDKTVELAREKGGIIELNYPITKEDKIALIRDPKGAGFTIYEGKNITSTRTKNKSNTLIWNELHTSEINKVIPFYEHIFNWNFKQLSAEFYQVFNHLNEHITDIYEIPNTVKGKYEYWISTFGIKNLQKTTSKILENNGTIILDEGDKILCTDDSQEAFFYIKEV